MLKELSPDDIKSILKQDISNNENIIEILTAIQNSGNATDHQNNELQKLLSISDQKKIILQKLANQHSNISENSNDNTNKKNKYLIELFFDNAGMHIGAINGEIGLNNFNQLFGQIIDPFQRKQENPPQQPEAVPTSTESEPEPQPAASAATPAASASAATPVATPAAASTPASASTPVATPASATPAAATPATPASASTPASAAQASATPASTLPTPAATATPVAALPTPASTAAALKPLTQDQIYELADKGITTINKQNTTDLVQNKKQIQYIAKSLGIPVSNAKVDTTPKQVPIWQIMAENYNPEFLQKYPDYLFLYGENKLNTGGEEKTQAIIRTSPNSFGINTCKAPGDCWKPGELKQATVQFLEDINKLLQVFFDPSSSNKHLSKKVPYRSIIIPVQKIGNQYKIALGRGIADLPKNAPEVYDMLEVLIEQLKRHLDNKLQPPKDSSQENANLKIPFTYTNNGRQIEGAKWVTGSPTLKPLQGITR